jgi:hypothetical protein
MEDNLELFDDLPLFQDKEIDKSKERFGHWAYARTIAKILKENDKPLTIGLFGEWGTGKSTIVNMLLEEIKEIPICPVVFNAWRHQDDSFRRQLLIAVGREVYGESDRKYRELTDLTGIKARHVDVEKEAEEKMPLKGLWGSFKEFLKWLVSDAKSARLTFIGLLFWLVISIAGCVLAYCCPGSAGQFLLMSLVVPVVLLLMGVIEKGTRRKLVAILDIRQPQGEKPRLSYPEQFESEFVECVKTLEKEKKRLLVVVDDLDRCDENAIVAALAVIKQFAGKSNCVFIVPCDEQQVIKAVSKAGTNHDYQGYESLRKFFDVAVRMDKIPEADLHIYAKYLVEQWKLSPRLAEMAVYSGARDARKVKAFLNSFKTRYWMIKAREPDYFASGTADRNLHLIAKLTALQEQFPEFYKRVCQRPDMLSEVEATLRTHTDEVSDKKEGIDVEKETGGNALLKRFLRYTADIDLREISDIIVGKRPEVIAEISTGPELLAALSEGDEQRFVKAVKGLDKTQGQRVVECIEQKTKEYEERELTVSLRMLVHCVLGVFSGESIWESDDLKDAKRSLGDVVVEAIGHDKSLVKEGGDLNGLESLLSVTTKADVVANAIVETYLKESSAVEGASYLALINRKSTYFEDEVPSVNEDVKKKLATEAEEEMLKQLVNLMVIDAGGKAIPSPEVINEVVNRLEAKDEAYNLNKIRVEVIRNYSEKVDWDGFVKKWSELTSKAQGSAGSIEKTNLGLALDALDDVGKITEEDGQVVCSGSLEIWSHNTEENTRKRMLTTFGTIYPLPLLQEAEKVINAVFKWLNARPVPETQEYLERLTSGWENFSEGKRKSLRIFAVKLLERFVEWVKGQVNVYNEKVEEIVNLIVKWNSTLNNEALLSDMVKSIVTETNDVAFEAWHKKSLGSLCDCLANKSLQDHGKMVIERVEAVKTTKQRRSLLLDTLITKLMPDNFDGNETDKMFHLFWHDDGNLREPVCEKFESLKAKFSSKDLFRNMSIIAREISNSSSEKITDKSNSVTVFLNNAEYLNPTDKTWVLSTVPALIHSTNTKESIAIGLLMVEKLGVKGEISRDILSGLEALREHTDENLKQRAIELLGKFGEEDQPSEDMDAPKEEDKG